ncbi:hypothetical protein CEXT_381281 [Caerostris extrusa]|uniref:Uncharacterized protein n=1 Tax=Caerostris extrusa TaxID=172846 RepID=A0AAV4XRR7_CAEEX|nr:hypothetical protein CEXT_381281 [Caerostris extrusa]
MFSDRGSSFGDNARKIDIRDLCRNNEASIPEDEMGFCVDRGSSFEKKIMRVKLTSGRDLCRNNEEYIPEDEMGFCVG